MHFKVAARTILHLGAELISSDDIAFYELIKNAFDAYSPRVSINVVIRVSYKDYEELNVLFNEIPSRTSKSKLTHATEQFRTECLSRIDYAAPYAEELGQEVSEANSLDSLLNLLKEANYIVIEDTGEGMSREDLEEVYLTIGTRVRLLEREQQRKMLERTGKRDGFRPVLGEKGVGRLSTMRLGERLRVETTRKNESYWNVLEIDWSLFSHESDALLEEIEISPVRGERKKDRNESGTKLYISGLNSEWSREKLRDIAKNEFSKLTDPFVPERLFPISMKFNGERVDIPDFDAIIFKYAHAVVEANFIFDETGSPRLTGRVNYKQRRRVKTFEITGAHLLSASGLHTTTALKSLGPFHMLLYWFNRKLLTAAEGVSDYQLVRNLVNQWGGGLMVYRDGFRVNPYGGPDDDWLKLDRKALASSGYKVNRAQIVGKVDISSIENPSLVDQTNREGLRNSPEKHALENLLRHVLHIQFKRFMDEIDEEVSAKEPVSFDTLEERVEIQEKQVRKTMKVLLQRYPAIKQDSQVLTVLEQAIEQIRSAMTEAKALAESYQKGRTQTLHLAGLGLMVEFLAHELNRATSHTLRTLASANRLGIREDIKSLFGTLEAQLKTLQKRMRILDPLSTTGRQVKESFDLIDWVREILRSHVAQFERHHIQINFYVEPARPNATLRVTAVKGMIVQIVENLISNSVYWLKQERRINRSFVPEIMVVIDTKAKEIRFSDNGPGIEYSQKEEVFQPFMTTKPAGEGKGLGLFISREIAEYNGAALYLLDELTPDRNTLNTFVLELEAKDK